MLIVVCDSLTRIKLIFFCILVKMRGNDDGAGHKAVLLSGPPGIGKTTTAQIVCKVGLCVMVAYC